MANLAEDMRSVYDYATAGIKGQDNQKFIALGKIRDTATRALAECGNPVTDEHPAAEPLSDEDVWGGEDGKRCRHGD